MTSNQILRKIIQDDTHRFVILNAGKNLNKVVVASNQIFRKITQDDGLSFVK
jgi:hypothetical protein